MQLIFEKSRPGRRAITFDPLDVPAPDPLPDNLRRESAADLPEVSELDVVRHFTALSQQNFGIDTHFYPLGSCTMKYNPKMTEAIAADHHFAHLHPLMGSVSAYQGLCQGALGVIHGLETSLAEIAGMKAVTLQPIAGAHLHQLDLCARFDCHQSVNSINS